ncbi:basic membrane lipoprotein Med (substrate-binding protein (PBP1-ABC) superfamily) [Mycoplasmopsis mustelae]|uniref:Basic membrane lipoprotein Med (Substrate-binding protein (PBP1-ABC) superfamily) n=1 Tax=Mycoplasmopsis mustelae TaxID=171289 RepID=A0A4R7UD24_9BACT|nr:BMP family ABC transporter substrate-binding protein [Mycoplasmopsis mustelae]TDV24319.1 basic membrane lipoprotein Med (substrate-binding protein (PBP1-ABC) superfamily) [Mycoplasmopsis mustelae]
MKKKIKKIFLGVTPVVLAGTSVIAAACGNQNDGKIEKVREKREITTPEAYIAPADRVAKLEKNNTFTLPEEDRGIGIVVVTDSGHVTDKSFNQSSWEAALAIQDQTKGNDGKPTVVVNNIEPTNSQYNAAYDAAFRSGAEIWVLTGFAHKGKIDTWIKRNATKLKTRDIKIFGIDFDLKGVDLGGFKKFYSLNFKINEASYIAGYAIAKFISENSNNKKLSSFGGGPFNGVTDYMTGYLKGILDWNTENPTKKVTHGTINLSSGFEPGTEMNAAINDTLAQKASVIYPVAGPATKSTLDILKSKNDNNTYVIGVDVDQSISLGTETKGRFLTSVLKDITQAVYDSILEVAFGNTKKVIFGNKQDAKGDFAQGWVGLAESTLTDEALRKKMNDNIKLAKEKFNGLSAEKKAFIDQDKAEMGGPNLQINDLVNKLVKKVNS